MQVELIYTGVDLSADEPQDLEPEVFGTYDAESAASLRDPFLRDMVLKTLKSGIESKSGVWSTKVVAESG